MKKALFLSTVLLVATPPLVLAADAAEPEKPDYTAQDTDPLGATPRPGINVDTELQAGQAADTDASPDYQGDATDPQGVTPRPGVNVDMEPPQDVESAIDPLGSPADPDTSISTGTGAGAGG